MAAHGRGHAVPSTDWRKQCKALERAKRQSVAGQAPHYHWSSLECNRAKALLFSHLSNSRPAVVTACLTCLWNYEATLNMQAVTVFRLLWILIQDSQLCSKVKIELISILYICYAFAMHCGMESHVKHHPSGRTVWTPEGRSARRCRRRDELLRDVPKPVPL